LEETLGGGGETRKPMGCCLGWFLMPSITSGCAVNNCQENADNSNTTETPLLYSQK